MCLVQQHPSQSGRTSLRPSPGTPCSACLACCASQMLCFFYRSKARLSTSQNRTVHFIVVVWGQAHTVFKVHLDSCSLFHPGLPHVHVTPKAKEASGREWEMAASRAVVQNDQVIPEIQESNCFSSTSWDWAALGSARL